MNYGKGNKSSEDLANKYSKQIEDVSTKNTEKLQKAIDAAENK